jgi:hypothetical protein
MRKTAALRKSTAAAVTAAYPLPDLAKGEAYAGVIIGPKNMPTHHLVLLPGEKESVTWKDAGAWAKKQGGELPTRKEQALLFANAGQHFQPRWYWSSEQHAERSEYAWMQTFDNGSQFSNGQGYKYRARAVRRVPI